MPTKKNSEEKWETPSLEWIHRIRREMAAGGDRGPMPLARQRALAKKYGGRLTQLSSKATKR